MVTDGLHGLVRAISICGDPSTTSLGISVSYGGGPSHTRDCGWLNLTAFNAMPAGLTVVTECTQCSDHPANVYWPPDLTGRYHTDLPLGPSQTGMGNTHMVCASVFCDRCRAEDYGQYTDMISWKEGRSMAWPRIGGGGGGGVRVWCVWRCYDLTVTQRIW